MSQEVEVLSTKLEQLAAEICRQSVARQKQEKENFLKLVAILKEGTSEMNLDLERLGDRLHLCCTFKAGPEDI